MIRLSFWSAFLSPWLMINETSVSALVGAALRALERPDYLLGSGAVGAMVAIAPGLLLSHAFGVWGAGFGLLAAYAASGAVLFFLLEREARHLPATDLSVVDPVMSRCSSAGVTGQPGRK